MTKAFNWSTVGVGGTTRDDGVDVAGDVLPTDGAASDCDSSGLSGSS